MKIEGKIYNNLNDCEALTTNDNDTDQQAFLIKTTEEMMKTDKVIMLTSDETGFCESVFLDTINKNLKG